MTLKYDSPPPLITFLNVIVWPPLLIGNTSVDDIEMFALSSLPYSNECILIFDSSLSLEVSFISGWYLFSLTVIVFGLIDPDIALSLSGTIIILLSWV